MRGKALEDFSRKSLQYINEFLKDSKLYFTINAKAYLTEFSQVLDLASRLKGDAKDT